MTENSSKTGKTSKITKKRPIYAFRSRPSSKTIKKRQNRAKSANPAPAVPEVALSGLPVSKETRISLSTQREATHNVFSAIGRENLISALLHSPHKKAANLISLLDDPDYATMSPLTLCKHAGVSVPDLLTIFRDFNVAQGMVNFILHTPEIMEDIAVDSKSIEFPCRACGGEGIFHPVGGLNGNGEDGEDAGDEGLAVEPCEVCEGRGKVRMAGDKASREMVLEAIGVRQRSGGGVNVINNIPGATSASSNLTSSMPSMADFTKNADRMESSQVYEAELVDSPSPATTSPNQPDPYGD